MHFKNRYPPLSVQNTLQICLINLDGKLEPSPVQILTSPIFKTTLLFNDTLNEADNRIMPVNSIHL